MGSRVLRRVSTMSNGILLQFGGSYLRWFNSSSWNFIRTLYSWLCLLWRLNDSYSKWWNYGSLMLDWELLSCRYNGNVRMSCRNILEFSWIGLVFTMSCYLLLQWKWYELWNYMPNWLLLPCRLNFTSSLPLRFIFLWNWAFIVNSMYWMSSRSLLWLGRNDYLQHC